MNTHHGLSTVLYMVTVLVLNACSTLQVGIDPTSTPPAMQHLMVSPLDFGCQCDAIDHIAFHGIGAPIHLPDGALVTRITVFYRVQNASTEGVNLIFQRQHRDQLETIAAATMAQRQDSGNHTDVLVIPATPLAQIDTGQYTYRLILQDPAPFSVEYVAMEIQHIQLDYLFAPTVPVVTPGTRTPVNAVDNALTPSPLLLGVTTLTPSAERAPTQEPTSEAATRTSYQTTVALWTATPGSAERPYPPPASIVTLTPTITLTPGTSVAPTFTFNSRTPTPTRTFDSPSSTPTRSPVPLP